MNRLTLSTIAITTAMVALSACSSQGAASEASGDPNYAFERVHALRTADLFNVAEPDSLADALPNREIVANTPSGTVRASWSDLVLTGTVTDVEPGTAIAYDDADPTSEGNEEESREVDFDDPSAHQRNVVVTVRRDWSAGDVAGAEVKVRMGVIGDADPTAFLASLRALQGEQVVMLLAAREDGRHIGDYFPTMGGAMIGRVAANGDITFSALGAEEKSFVAGVDSIDELRAEAKKPKQVIAP